MFHLREEKRKGRNCSRDYYGAQNICRYWYVNLSRFENAETFTTDAPVLGIACPCCQRSSVCMCRMRQRASSTLTKKKAQRKVSCYFCKESCNCFDQPCLRVQIYLVSINYLHLRKFREAKSRAASNGLTCDAARLFSSRGKRAFWTQAIRTWSPAGGNALSFARHFAVMWCGAPAASQSWRRSAKICYEMRVPCSVSKKRVNSEWMQQDQRVTEKVW